MTKAAEWLGVEDFPAPTFGELAWATQREEGDIYEVSKFALCVHVEHKLNQKRGDRRVIDTDARCCYCDVPCVRDYMSAALLYLAEQAYKRVQHCFTYVDSHDKVWDLCTDCVGDDTLKAEFRRMRDKGLSIPSDDVLPSVQNLIRFQSKQNNLVFPLRAMGRPSSVSHWFYRSWLVMALSNIVARKVRVWGVLPVLRPSYECLEDTMRNYKERVNNLKRQLVDVQQSVMRLSQQTAYADHQICLVCQDAPREVVLLFCGHFCVCQACSRKINDKCPVCRSEVVQVSQPVYNC